MGHRRLGALYRTRNWSEVISLLQYGADAAQIAVASMKAAQKGLLASGGDVGLVESFWLLTQLPIVAKEDNFVAALQAKGLQVPETPTLIDIVAAVSDCVDSRMANNKGRTDLGEMAQMALSETLSRVIGQRTSNLFGSDVVQLQQTFRDLGKINQFSIVAREFFSRLTFKALDYFLSRVSYDHFGVDKRFTTLGQHADFQKALENHCREAAVIVERFAGDWFSKTRWENKGISREKAKGFTKHAMTKFVTEFGMGAV